MFARGAARREATAASRWARVRVSLDGCRLALTRSPGGLAMLPEEGREPTGSQVLRVG